MYVINAIVREVIDGDTIKFDFPGTPPVAFPRRTFKQRSVRFWGIDAPEKKQGEIGEKAKKQLKKLLPAGSEIQILTAIDRTDAHGRVLGRIFKGGRDVNLRMLKSGWVVMYQIYPNLCNYVQYRSAFMEAKEKKRGLFGLDSFEWPFEWRMKQEGRPPTKYVGDFSTGYYYYPIEYRLIKPEDRIFFFTESECRKAGFVVRPKSKVL